mmetsp:Transcript_1702/g.10479  ORF Transcript_1702/g.10479 Transcript_1702/m.10479 type:complete len:299 (+) Transcript_1702:1648-2544(+)
MEHGAKGRVTNPRLCNRHVGCWVVGCTNRCAARRCLREVGSPQERGSSSRLAREPIALVESFGPPCQPARQSRPVGRIFAVQDGSGSDHESEVVPTGMVASVFFFVLLLCIQDPSGKRFRRPHGGTGTSRIRSNAVLFSLRSMFAWMSRESVLSFDWTCFADERRGVVATGGRCRTGVPRDRRGDVHVSASVSDSSSLSLGGKSGIRFPSLTKVPSTSSASDSVSLYTRPVSRNVRCTSMISAPSLHEAYASSSSWLSETNACPQLNLSKTACASDGHPAMYNAAANASAHESLDGLP